MQEFNIYEYLDSFKTKQAIKDELAKLQKNIENIRFGRIDLKSLLWHKKRILLDKFNKEYCTIESYMDDLGRTHWYWIEIEEWQKAHNIAPKGMKMGSDE